MNTRYIGKVKVRQSSSEKGASLEVTIPKGVLILLDVKPGRLLDVYVDEADGKIIYVLKNK